MTPSPAEEEPPDLQLPVSCLFGYSNAALNAFIHKRTRYDQLPKANESFGVTDLEQCLRTMLLEETASKDSPPANNVAAGSGSGAGLPVSANDDDNGGPGATAKRNENDSGGFRGHKPLLAMMRELDLDADTTMVDHHNTPLNEEASRKLGFYRGTPIPQSPSPISLDPSPVGYRQYRLERPNWTRFTSSPGYTMHRLRGNDSARMQSGFARPLGPEPARMKLRGSRYVLLAVACSCLFLVCDMLGMIPCVLTKRDAGEEESSNEVAGLRGAEGPTEAIIPACLMLMGCCSVEGADQRDCQSFVIHQTRRHRIMNIVPIVVLSILLTASHQPFLPSPDCFRLSFSLKALKSKTFFILLSSRSAR